MDSVGRVGRVPAQAVKAGAGRGLRVFDSQGKAAVAIDDDDGDAADAQLRGMLGVISEKVLLLRRMTVDLKIFWKAAGRRQQSHRGLRQPNDSNMRGNFCANLKAVVGVRAEGIVAVLQPVEADQREPALGCLKVGRALRAPGLEFSLPRAVIRRGAGSGGGERESHEQSDGG